MKNKLTAVLAVLLVIAVGFIVYQNFLTGGIKDGGTDEAELYTCGMHPDIISDEPGNCPICEMKLTPIKKEPASSDERKIAYWVAPMNPNEIYDSPGKSKMGMDLVPVYEDEVSGGGVVKIDPVVQQNINVKTTEVVKREINPVIITNGVISADERNEYAVTTKVGGWIEKLYVNFTGQQVHKGDKLAEIYSPELVSAQQEYLSALEYNNQMQSSGNKLLVNSGENLLNNAYEKLKLLDMPGKDIFTLENESVIKKSIHVYAPADGTVLMKDISEGQKVMPGGLLMHISDLSKLWVLADVYEEDLSKVEIGDPAKIYVNSIPGKVIKGNISFIDRVVDPKTRTAKVRIDISNNDLQLKPAMLTRVELSFESDYVVSIPEESVIRSGQKNIAVLALGNGKFKPVEVMLGRYSNGYYEVLAGLNEGNRIVSSAQFLIDSESNLKSALKQFTSSSMEKDEMKKEKQSGHEHGEVEETSKGSGNKYGIESPLIRLGVIDVESIDQNGDGKLYECPMDWDIISDEAGRCPSCEMKLKEYSIDEVKNNLLKNGYEVKE
ncbi:MAG: efflux RND transporter periplasmic adaptor subunit [Ignavibacteria bacterium]|jgi:Cu(I)/Ag(I) efflux system membrane fusion protein/cobalt-zinc-cadmium efflux system membrane fusion protein